MKAENRFFELLPKVVPADKETVVKIRPLFDHVYFNSDRQYQITYYPVEEIALQSGWPKQNRQNLTVIDDCLRLSQYFEGEQEHVLLVEEVLGSNRRLVGEFRIYSVQPDLFDRKPYKGDIHMHSHLSDGRESPGYVAGCCRKIGLDFMALTDHRKYEPSLAAKQAYDGVPIDLRIYPGEEVHPPNNPVHIVNFGGSFSVNELFEDKEKYQAEVNQIEQQLGPLPAGVDRYVYASCCWSFEKIRKGGGLGVFCHPYWFTGHRYSPSGALTSYLLQTQPFDAYELLGGYDRQSVDSNTLQVTRYYEERAMGNELPIVGVSDSHGCETGSLFGWYYTVVLSPTLTHSDLIISIKDLFSVAVESIPGESIRVYGPFRLVKYVLFLLREVLPQQDTLCVEEGRLMLAHLAGDTSAAKSLKTLSGRTARRLDTLWA